MKTLRVLSVALCLAGCSANEAPKKPATPASVPVVHAVAADGGPEKTVRAYLTWYSTHHTKLPANFIKSVGRGDTASYYAVDFRVTESWLTAVRGSGLLSDAYLQAWHNYFKQYADTLRLHRQNDGPPTGFEYDFLMLSQEPDTKATELLAGTCTTTAASPTRAVVVALGPQHEGWREGMNFKLGKSANGKWQIDTISAPEN